MPPQDEAGEQLVVHEAEQARPAQVQRLARGEGGGGKAILATAVVAPSGCEPLRELARGPGASTVWPAATAASSVADLHAERNGRGHR